MVRTLAVALLLGAISTGAQAADKSTRSASSVEHFIVTVPGANDEWTTTPIRLEAGDLLVCTADGSVKLGEFVGSTGPNGRSDGTGTLRMKIGATKVLPVGSQAVISREAGLVKLKVHDSRYTDNSGAYQVELVRVPAAMIPEAVAAVAEE